MHAAPAFYAGCIHHYQSARYSGHQQSISNETFNAQGIKTMCGTWIPGVSRIDSVSGINGDNNCEIGQIGPRELKVTRTRGPSRGVRCDISS